MKKTILALILGILIAPFALWILMTIGLNVWFHGSMVWNQWTIPDSLYVEEGDRFVVVESFELGEFYREPYTGGKTEVSAGTIFKALSDSAPGSSGFWADVIVPENMEAFEKQVVSESERPSPKDDAYWPRRRLNLLGSRS